MLAVAGYSQPVDEIIKLKNLKKKIFTSNSQKDAYPYVNFFLSKRLGIYYATKEKKIK